MEDLLSRRVPEIDPIRFSRRKGIALGASAAAALAVRSAFAQSNTPVPTPSGTETPVAIDDPVSANGAYAQVISGAGGEFYEGVWTYETYQQAVEAGIVSDATLDQLPAELNWLTTCRMFAPNDANPSGMGFDYDTSLILASHLNEDDSKAAKTGFLNVAASQVPGIVDRTPELKGLRKGVNFYQVDSSLGDGTSTSWGLAVNRIGEYLAVLAQTTYAVPIDWETTADVFAAVEENLTNSRGVPTIGPHLLLNPDASPTAFGIAAFDGQNFPQFSDADGDLEKRTSVNEGVDSHAQNVIRWPESPAGDVYFLNDVRSFANPDAAAAWLSANAGLPDPGVYEYADFDAELARIVAENGFPIEVFTAVSAWEGLFAFQDGLIPFGELAIQDESLVRMLKVLKLDSVLPADTSPDSVDEEVVASLLNLAGDAVLLADEGSVLGMPVSALAP